MVPGKAREVNIPCTSANQAETELEPDDPIVIEDNEEFTNASRTNKHRRSNIAPRKSNRRNKG